MRRPARWVAAVAVAAAAVVGALLLVDTGTDVADVLGAPDAVTVPVQSEAVPDAALVYSPELGRGVFTAAGLPSVDSDETYQLWLIEGETPIPAGVFVPDAPATPRCCSTGRSPPTRPRADHRAGRRQRQPDRRDPRRHADRGVPERTGPAPVGPGRVSRLRVPPAETTPRSTRWRASAAASPRLGKTSRTWRSRSRSAGPAGRSRPPTTRRRTGPRERRRSPSGGSAPRSRRRGGASAHPRRVSSAAAPRSTRRWRPPSRRRRRRHAAGDVARRLS